MTTPAEYLDTFVRAYALLPARRRGKPAGPAERPERAPSIFIVFGTHATPDASQQLSVGAYRIYATAALMARQNNPAITGVSLVEEGLVYADKLPERAPEEFEALQAYTRSQPSAAPLHDGRTLDDVLRDNPMVTGWLREYAAGTGPEQRQRYQAVLAAERTTPRYKPLALLSRTQLVEDVLFRLGAEAKAAIIGWKLPFSLSRLALDATENKRGDGFSLVLWQHEGKPSQWRPRVRFRHLDSTMAFIDFASWRLGTDTAGAPRFSQYRGRFIDGHTLAAALSNESHTLTSAGAVFGAAVPEAGDDAPTGTDTTAEAAPCRRDVALAWSLYEKLMEEYERYAIELAPERAYSASSVGKAHLSGMGITPPLEKWPDFPKEVLGEAMTAFDGARIETRIRRTPVPVVTLDFLSMYPTVDALMGMQRSLVAERLEIADATDEARTLLETVTADDCFHHELWPKLACCSAEIVPDDEAVPVRAKYDGLNLGTGVNLFRSHRPHVYALADLVASKVKLGKVPNVQRAWRLVPRGVQNGLRPITLRGQVEVDPRRGDFFRLAVQERQRVKRGDPPYDQMPAEERDRLSQFLKTFMNSTEYGIFGEMHSQRRRGNVPVDVYGMHHFTDKVNRPEEPGPWCFPPFAATITSAARLMLALLEHEIAARGGCYAFADTDGAAIVATEHGALVPCEHGSERMPDGSGAVRALSWADVKSICRRFEALNPYDRAAVPGSILKVEDENYPLEPQDADSLAGEAKRQPETTEPSGLLPDAVTGHSWGSPGGGRPETSAGSGQARLEAEPADGPADGWRQLYAYCIASKRYCLYNEGDDGRPLLRKASEHALGYLLNPLRPEEQSLRGQREWVRQLWQYVLERELGMDPQEPEWLDMPALSMLSASSPRDWHLYDANNAGKAYADRIKPFSVLLAAHLRRNIAGQRIVPEGADPLRFQLVAPMPTDFSIGSVLALDWVNRQDGKYYRVTLDEHSRSADEAVLQTYRDVLAEYAIHPEFKSACPDGAVCRTHTRGMLGMRRVIEGRMRYCGKEGNEAEERNAGLQRDPDEFQIEYVDETARVEALRDALGVLRRDEVAAKAGISARRLRDAVSSNSRHRERGIAARERAAHAALCDSLRLMGGPDGRTLSLDALASVYTETLASIRTELWARLRALHTEGISERKLAALLGTSQATLHRWITFGLPDDAAALAGIRKRVPAVERTIAGS